MTELEAIKEIGKALAAEANKDLAPAMDYYRVRGRR